MDAQSLQRREDAHPQIVGNFGGDLGNDDAENGIGQQFQNPNDHNQKNDEQHLPVILAADGQNLVIEHFGTDQRADNCQRCGGYQAKEDGDGPSEIVAIHSKKPLENAGFIPAVGADFALLFGIAISAFGAIIFQIAELFDGDTLFLLGVFHTVGKFCKGICKSDRELAEDGFASILAG